jgi:hypothetical protein
MTSITEKIARAKEYQESTRVFKDVPVTLDAGDAVKRQDLVDELETLNQTREAILYPADERLGHSPDTTEVDARIEAVQGELDALEEAELGTLAIVRVYRVPGELWPEITLRNPMREDVPADRMVGYNITAVTKQTIHAFGRLVEDGEETQLAEETWNEIFVLIGGRQFEDLTDAVYGLNVAQPERRADRLKNSYEAATASAKK